MSRIDRPGRKLALLIVAGLVLVSSQAFAAPARADEIMPVDESTEEVVAEETAAIDAGIIPDWYMDPVEPPVRGCPERGTHYSVSAKRNLHIPTGIDFKSGPGGTTKALIQHSLSATLKVNIGAKVNASAIVAGAEATYNIEASVTATIAQTYEYSHSIAKNKYGHLRFGNWGWKMNLEKYIVDQNCRISSTTKGTVAAMPSATTWGYKYWETSS